MYFGFSTNAGSPPTKNGLDEAPWSRRPVFDADDSTVFYTTRFAGSGQPGRLYAVDITGSCESPTGLRLDLVDGGTDLQLTWTDTWDATAYTVYEDVAPNGAFDTVTGTATSGVDGVTVTPPLDTRFYRVVASAPGCP